jgi:hypothetical protein
MDGRALLVSVVLLAPAATGGAEPAVVIPPQPTVVAPPTAPNPAPIADPLPTIAGNAPAATHGSASVFGMDLLLGQQTGLRPHVAVYSNERSSLLVEGFYGATLTKYGGSEAAAVGLRWVMTRGGCDAVTLGPGVDVFFNFNEEKATFLAPTVDIAWRHSFGERAGLLIGVNAGVGVGISGQDDNNDRDDIAGKVTPLISFFAGLRY